MKKEPKSIKVSTRTILSIELTKSGKVRYQRQGTHDKIINLLVNAMIEDDELRHLMGDALLTSFIIDAANQDKKSKIDRQLKQKGQAVD